MEARLLENGDSIEVLMPDDRRFTFPIHELQATRRPPRLDTCACNLPVKTPVQALAAARDVAEEFAILKDLI